MHSPLPWPRPLRRPWLYAVSLALLAACASCRDNAAAPSARRPTANVTAADVVTPSADPPSDVAAERPISSPVDPADLVPIDGDLPGGCVTCHVDVSDELEGSAHLAEDIGCVECHGPSDAHVRDENNEAKPDQVFARADVDRLCSECHRCSRPGASEPAAQPPANRKVCIDCHKAHSLAPLERK